MPQVLLKTGEVKKIPDEQLLTFLRENRDLIQSQKGRSCRKALKTDLVTPTNTK